MYKHVSKILNIVSKLLFKVEIEGVDNIPKEGACIIAANHKSNWDPILIAGLINTRTINCVAKKELFKVPVLKSILKKCFVIPVDRENPDMSTIKTILKVLKNEEVLGIFPEGTRHKDLETFAEPKSGVGMFALKGKAKVVPVSIVTTYKLFSKVHIYISEPIEFDDYYGKKATAQDYKDVSQSIMKVIEDNYFEIKNSL